MQRGRRTKDVFRVQVNYGQGWYSLSQRETEQEALDDLTDFRLNDPDPDYRIEPRRIYPKRSFD